MGYLLFYRWQLHIVAVDSGEIIIISGRHIDAYILKRHGDVVAFTESLWHDLFLIVTSTIDDDIGRRLKRIFS